MLCDEGKNCQKHIIYSYWWQVCVFVYAHVIGDKDRTVEYLTDTYLLKQK